MSALAEILPWQHQEWQYLQRYIVQKRIPQALLITGTNGLGKRQLADQFARVLLCGQSDAHGIACGQCQSCLLFNAKTHPDLIYVEQEEIGKKITIAQIRSLNTALTLKPQFDSYRVVIVNPAEQMNNAAANAFLKCLEEPTERTSIILITATPSRLPATIRSRCQKLSISTPDTATLHAWLKHNNIHNDLEILGKLTRNAPLLALQVATENHIASRLACFASWLAIAKHQNHPVIVAEQWLALPDTALLFWLTSWVMDLIKCVHQVQAEHLYNADLTKPLQELARQLKLTDLYALYDLLLTSHKQLHTQINKQLLLEEILITWSNLSATH